MKYTILFLTVFLTAVSAHSQSTTVNPKVSGGCSSKSKAAGDGDFIGGIMGKFKEGMDGLANGLGSLAKSTIGIGASVGIGGKGKDSLIGTDLNVGLGTGGLDAQANVNAGKGLIDAGIKAGVDVSSGLKTKVKADVKAGGIGANLGVDVGIGGNDNGKN